VKMMNPTMMGHVKSVLCLHYKLQPLEKINQYLWNVSSVKGQFAKLAVLGKGPSFCLTPTGS
jgi:hypothetical protein